MFFCHHAFPAHHPWPLEKWQRGVLSCCKKRLKSEGLWCSGSPRWTDLTGGQFFLLQRVLFRPSSCLPCNQAVAWVRSNMVPSVTRHPGNSLETVILFFQVFFCLRTVLYCFLGCGPSKLNGCSATGKSPLVILPLTNVRNFICLFWASWRSGFFLCTPSKCCFRKHLCCWSLNLIWVLCCGVSFGTLFFSVASPPGRVPGLGFFNSRPGK